MMTVDNTFAQDIEEAAYDEEIIGCVIGKWDAYFGDEKGLGGAPINVVLEWHEARKYLDYEYECGYGLADCHPIYAWTNTYVLFVYEYDGSTSISRKPRNPMNCTPYYN